MLILLMVNDMMTFINFNNIQSKTSKWIAVINQKDNDDAWQGEIIETSVKDDNMQHEISG